MNFLLLITSVLVLLIVYFISGSFASLLMSVLTLFLGGILILLLGKSRKERSDMITVMLVASVVFTLATIMNYLDIIANYSSFADLGNDNYSFYLASLDGVGAYSLQEIFNECIIQNIHYENGGYFFYIKALAYLSSKIADGNHLLLQQLGTAMPSILSSIVLYGILSKYCPTSKAVRYTCLFMVLSPLILHSVGIHRDAMIAFFYFVLIYLWLIKDFSLKIGLLQFAISIILFFFREQHGLFAASFIIVSILSSHGQKRIVYIFSIIALIGIFGASFLMEMISNNLAETNDYYYNLRADKLSGLSSGIGRFIYMLPSPIKEVAQIFFLQLRFPPWLALSEANNISAVVLGLLSFFISFSWFFVFIFTVISVIKKGINYLPKKLFYGLILLFFFLLLSSSNLDSRRVVCMYPLMYVSYVYYNEFVLSNKWVLTFRHRYIFVYFGFCLLYLVLKARVG